MDEAGVLLHDLRLRGAAAVPVGAAADELVAGRLAVRRGDRLALTPSGRAAADARARLPTGTDAEDHARRAYTAFRPLNAAVIKACHDWQVAPDGGAVARLRSLDDRAGPVVRRLGRAVPRFAEYRSRLRVARQRVENGDTVWFTSPRCDSYHNVWMQLHEDLLLALGLDRNRGDT